MTTAYGTREKTLAALIPHSHRGGHYCSLCGLGEAAPVHHWDEHRATRTHTPQTPPAGSGRLYDGDDPTRRGADEDAYQTALTGDRS